MVTTIMPISAALKKFRESRKFSQDDMAQRMKVSRTMYQAYEYGKAEPSVRYVINLALAENVSADYLLGLSDEPVRTEPPPADDDITEVGRVITEAIRTAVNRRLQEQREVPT